MPRGENLKDVDRSAAGRKGGHARAEAIARRKAEDAERIEQTWRELHDKMDARLAAIIEAGGDSEALRAILAGHDRLAGRPTQHTELTGADGGPVVLENDVDADQAAAVLRTLEESGLVARGSANGDTPADEVHTP